MTDSTKETIQSTHVSPTKYYYTRKKSSENFISSRDGPKKYTNKAEIEECKKTILHLLCVFLQM